MDETPLGETCFYMCESEHERDFFFSSNTGVLDETRVPGLGQITLVNRVLTKNEGHLGKKLHGNRKIAVERAVGVWEHTDS